MGFSFFSFFPSFVHVLSSSLSMIFYSIIVCTPKYIYIMLIPRKLSMFKLGPLYPRAWGPFTCGFIQIVWLGRKLEMVQVHFTVDFEGPIGQIHSIGWKYCTWDFTWHQGDNVSWYVGYWGVSPIWCPHVFLTSKDHQNLDLDVYSIIQKDKKSETLVLRIGVELKNRVGVILELI